jgi:hypothetical protein
MAVAHPGALTWRAIDPVASRRVLVDHLRMKERYADSAREAGAMRGSIWWGRELVASAEA